MDKNTNLAEEYIKFTTNPENKDATWFDFFDYVGVDRESASDFVIACIWKQTKEILERRSRE